MRRLRRALDNLALLAASLVVTLLVAEVIFRFLPVAIGPPVQEPTLANPIQRYKPNTAFTWSLGWDFDVVVHGRTNAQGFVADYDYDPKAATPLVAVAGDSFVEALMVPFAETLTGRLQAMLGPNGRAYAFAQSGSPLSQYVAYARHACAFYRPQRLVVVVVGNDFDESLYDQRLREGIYHLHPRPDGGFDVRITPPKTPSLAEAVARRSALALYLVRNLRVGNLRERINTPRVPSYVGNTRADVDPTRLAEGERVIAWFLTTLPDAACLSPHQIVLVVDAMRPEVYDAAALAGAQASYFGRMRRTLMEQASARGFAVVDMEARFRDAYAADRHPFEHPADGHWNAHAHEVAADAVRKALGDWPPPTAARLNH